MIPPPIHRLSQLIPLPPGYDRAIAGVALDSREIRPGYVFLACQGGKAHGREHIAAAIAAGAAAILLEDGGEPALRGGIPCIPIPHLRRRVSELAGTFYGHPARALKLAGVTGTNGKTSITHFMAQALPQPCGLIGTLGYGIYGDLQAGQHTTPDAARLQAALAEIRAGGAAHAVMEVSSHALDQGRVDGLEFHTAIFTNLSRDHLDYHGTMQAYGAAKRRLFHWHGLRYAVINLDDEFGRRLDVPAGVERIGYSLHDASAEIYCPAWQPEAGGSRLQVRTAAGAGEITVPLIGEFYVSNVLAALGGLLSLGMDWDSARASLQALRPVPGRMERYHAAGKPMAVIDYAHTPDALERVLQSLRRYCQGRLWCVFGCGGERDPGKRPIMGNIAQEWADQAIVTDDNPRHEDSAAIIQAILTGMEHPMSATVLPNRREAIEFALNSARPDDVVLIAGKGAETYQQIGSHKFPFSDREIVAQWLAG
jgi:UDP-N-acetylmuramoyl-L-alanyl-D-glutamate--2,6-diaminopimelate ligase